MNSGKHKAKKIIGTIILGLASAFLLFSAFAKFTHQPGSEMLEVMWGLGAYLIPLAIIEAGGTILLWLTPTRRIALLIMSGYMGGAILAELIMGMSGVFAGGILIMLWLGSYLRYGSWAHCHCGCHDDCKDCKNGTCSIHPEKCNCKPGCECIKGKCTC